MKVYFSGSFSGFHRKFERAGTAIPLGRCFEYGGYSWSIPMAYACREGLVMDIFRWIPRASLLRFYEKWGERLEADPAGEGLDQEERLQAEADSPLGGFFPTFRAHLNGGELKGEGYSGTSWQTAWGSGLKVHEALAGRDGQGEKRTDGKGLLETIEDREIRELMEAYDLNPADCWMCYRVRFLWPGQKKRRISSLSLIIGCQRTEHSCGCHFETSAGAPPFTLSFSHPITGENHRLHVVSVEMGRMGQEAFFQKQGVAYPPCYQHLLYEAEPDCPLGGHFLVKDRGESDLPIPTAEKKGRRKDHACSAAAIGIIGGSDGPTAILLGGKGEAGRGRREAFSSLHFSESFTVSWYVTLQLASFEPERIELLCSAP